MGLYSVSVLSILDIHTIDLISGISVVIREIEVVLIWFAENLPRFNLAIKELSPFRKFHFG